jgi:signal peptide peptidase SppA
MRVAQYIRSTPFAMLPSAYEAMCEIVELRVQGVRLPKEKKKQRLEAARRTPGLAMAPAGPGGVAVLKLFGCLSQRVDLMDEMSGGTSLEKWCHEFQEAAADPNVGGIVINADSPGGSVFYVQVAATMIADAVANSGKPIVGVVNSQVASACTWLLSQCSEVVVVPGGMVGGIGVICCRPDVSKMNDMLGLKYTYITSPAGGYKAEGVPDEPAEPEELMYIQEVADSYYVPFVNALAAGRRVSAKKVREEFGQGRMLTAEKAVAVGLADRIATLQEVVDGMVPKGSKGRLAAENMGVTYFDTEKQEMAAAEQPSPPVDLALARARLLAGARRTA